MKKRFISILTAVIVFALIVGCSPQKKQETTGTKVALSEGSVSEETEVKETTEEEAKAKLPEGVETLIVETDFFWIVQMDDQNEIDFTKVVMESNKEPYALIWNMYDYPHIYGLVFWNAENVGENGNVSASVIVDTIDEILTLTVTIDSKKDIILIEKDDFLLERPRLLATTTAEPCLKAHPFSYINDELYGLGKNRPLEKIEGEVVLWENEKFTYYSGPTISEGEEYYPKYAWDYTELLKDDNVLILTMVTPGYKEASGIVSVIQPDSPQETKRINLIPDRDLVIYNEETESWYIMQSFYFIEGGFYIYIGASQFYDR